VRCKRACLPVCLSVCLSVTMKWNSLDRSWQAGWGDVTTHGAMVGELEPDTLGEVPRVVTEATDSVS
jgi:hypothetical protein